MGRSTGLAGPAEAASDTKAAPGAQAPAGGEGASGAQASSGGEAPSGADASSGTHAPSGTGAPTGGEAPSGAGASSGTQAPSGAGASSGAEAAEGVAVRVRDTLEGVFAAVAATRDAITALLASVADRDGSPVSADLAALRPGLHARLADHRLVSGIGFVAAPGLLADVPAWLEWWQRGPEGSVRPLLLDLDPEHSAYSDYTHWDWYALPRETGQRAVAGPYVDYLCSDEYSLTLSAPVTVEGRFVGVAAADVYLRHFEAAVMPVLQRLPGPARLVNARGRVAASTDPAHLAGSLTKGHDFAALLAGPPTRTRTDGLHLLPCAGIPLVLVTAAD
ncbi:PDC sensor domain-containing protein [Streptomyces sp. ISL-36]|nr:PDC sensor domain-containing protein [Streptomyces sp. ISL-36]